MATEPERLTCEIERDEDGVYVASIPSLPGCHTQGSTREQVSERIREAICAHTGDWPKGEIELVWRDREVVS